MSLVVLICPKCSKRVGVLPGSAAYCFGTGAGQAHPITVMKPKKEESDGSQ